MFYEYLLVISPEGNVKCDIVRIKKIFGEHGCLYADKLVPHITLSNFIQSSLYEGEIINLFKVYISSIEPLEVTLNGFGMFKRHTLYANVERKDVIQQVVQGLKSRFKNQMQAFDKIPPYFIYKPHVTIARGMSELQAEYALSKWISQTYQGSFTVNSILLLRREWKGFNRNCNNYDRVCDFTFEGKNLYGRQLGLFGEEGMA